MSVQGWQANVDGLISCLEAWLDNVAVSLQQLFQQINLLSLTLNPPAPEPQLAQPVTPLAPKHESKSGMSFLNPVLPLTCLNYNRPLFLQKIPRWLMFCSCSKVESACGELWSEAGGRCVAPLLRALARSSRGFSIPLVPTVLCHRLHHRFLNPGHRRSSNITLYDAF